MRKRIDVPQKKREAIYHELLSLSKENILPRGAISRASKKHDFSFRTIKRIWEMGLAPNKRSNTGRKVKWTDDVVSSRIKSSLRKWDSGFYFIKENTERPAKGLS